MSQAFDELRNIAWRALDGAHRIHARGGATARRYRDGFAPIAAVADPSRPDLVALRALAEPGQTLVLAGVERADWPGFDLLYEAEVEQMAAVDTPELRDDGGFIAVRPLGADDAAAMQDLVARTRPGPFGPRALQLGRFVGVFAERRLVAMAGLRMAAGGWRELSAVCTDPAFTGRGLASVLVRHLQRELAQQGQRLFLHVDTGNRRARTLYRSLDFVPLRRQRLSVLRRRAD